MKIMNLFKQWRYRRYLKSINFRVAKKPLVFDDPPDVTFTRTEGSNS